MKIRLALCAIFLMLLPPILVVGCRQQPTTHQKIAFLSTRDGSSEIYVMNTDGSNQKNLTRNSFWDGLPAWSPDGYHIAFDSIRDDNPEIYV